jgi:hypothetical protein
MLSIADRPVSGAAPIMLKLNLLSLHFSRVTLECTFVRMLFKIIPLFYRISYILFQEGMIEI